MKKQFQFLALSTVWTVSFLCRVYVAGKTEENQYFLTDVVDLDGNQPETADILEILDEAEAYIDEHIDAWYAEEADAKKCRIEGYLDRHGSDSPSHYGTRNVYRACGLSTDPLEAAQDLDHPITPGTAGFSYL